MKILVLLFTCFTITINAQELGEINPKVKFAALSNKQTNIIFPNGWKTQSSNVLATFAQLDSTTTNTLGNKTRKWNVVMQHNTVIPNAYVRMAPLRSEFYLTPDMDNMQNGTLPWLQLLATHEYRHIQQFSNFNNGLTKVFSFLLGQQGQLLANGLAVPDYFFEGDAVFQETITTPQGRGMLPSFFSEMKALRQDGIKRNWMQLRNGSFKYVTPSHYPLGYQIVAYGYEKYGNDFWKKVTKEATSFKGLFYPWSQAIKRNAGISYRTFRDSALSFFAKDINSDELVTASKYIAIDKPKVVTNYQFIQTTENNELFYIKNAFDAIPAFYRNDGGKEILIVNKHIGLDNYFNIKKDKIIYTSYTTDSRYSFTNYSNIVVFDRIKRSHSTLTQKGKYFHPSWSEDAEKIVSTHIDATGNYSLHILNTKGETLQILQNSNTILHTYPKFYKGNKILSIIRYENGSTQLVQTDIETNTIDKTFATPTYKAMGYPQLIGDTMWLNIAHNNSEQIAVIDLVKNEIYTATNNANSFYYPSPFGNKVYFSMVTSKGQLLSKINRNELQWTKLTNKELSADATVYIQQAFAKRNQLQLTPFRNDTSIDHHRYKRGAHLFNFHSLQPTITQTEYGLSLFSDNILNNLSANVNYLYNKNEGSNTYGITATYGGLFPFINIGASTTQNRTAVLSGTSYQFSTANAYAGVSIPLSTYKGSFIRSASVAYTFNTEQLFYTGIGKNIFKNNAYQYGSFFATAVNQQTKAVQQINPRWAQAASISFRDAYNFTKNKKLVFNGRFFLPGLQNNHSLVISGSLQLRDTTRDYFSNNFAYSRGYQALNTRQMIKFGADYHFPIWYPDFGFGNIVYINRLRGNIFFDYNNAKARVSGVLTNIINKSIGLEAYADIKLWNAFPLTIGARYSHLLDVDLLNPTRKNLFELVLPIDIIPR